MISAVIAAIDHWRHDWWNQTLMTLLWLGCTLTIVLGPPATLAIYAQNRRLAEGDAPSAREMWRDLGRVFGVSWRWALGNLLVLTVLGFGFLFYGYNPSAFNVFGMLICGVVSAVWLMMQLYALPVLTWQDELSVWLAWRNAFALLIHAPLQSLLYLLVTAVLWIMCLVLFLPLLAGGVGLIVLVGCTFVYQRLSALEFDDE